MIACYGTELRVDDARLMQLLGAAAEAIEEALMSLSPDDRERRGDGHDDQFELDVLADGAAVDVLVAGGVGVFSEESGVHRPERAIRVVLDPIDGSTNCSRGLDPYGPSICAFDGDGPRVGLVVNLASGRRYTALRGGGAWCDDAELVVRERPRIGVVATGDPIPTLQPQAWTRISGASAHDLCRVADGTFDGYADDRNTVSIWDYASAALILREAGGAVVERDGRDLFDLSEPTGHRLLAASSPAQIDMLRRLLALRDVSASPAGTSLSAP